VIRAVLVIGWIGLLLLLATAVDGYRVVDEAGAQRHLTLALFPTGALLFTDFCVLVYLAGTLRVVGRTAAELGLAAEWLAERRQLVRSVAVWPLLGIAALGLLFGSGFPLFAESWPAWVHHGAFVTAALLHVVFLLHAARALRHGEERLAAFATAAEAAGGR
jgi:hypothetical protein